MVWNLASHPAFADDGNEPVSAWWVDIAFSPDQVVVSGLPVSRFNSQWKTAKALTHKTLIGKISPEDQAQFKASKFKFSARGDLNKDGRQDRVFVGIYRKKDGTEGRFLSIFQNGSLVKTFERDGMPGFSALLLSDGELRWYFCLECGEYESLAWNNSGLFLQ